MNLTQLFNPIEKIVGLEISSRRINAAVLTRDKKGELKIIQRSAALAQDTVQNGEIKKLEELAQALKNFWQANKNEFQSKYAILSLPSQLAFCDILKLPQLSKEQTQEAIKLNLSNKALFPVDQKETYYDWQPVQSKDVYHQYLLVSFALWEKIKPWVELCAQAGIEPLAFEPSIFSAARTMANFENKTGLLIRIVEEGLEFAVVAENEVRFSRFVPMPEKIESFDQFKEFIKEESSKVINFYTTDDSHNGEIQSITVIPNFAKKNELEEYLAKNLGIAAEHIKFPHQIRDVVGNSLDESMLAAIGAAQRGAIRREEDALISLMEIGTEENYQRTRLLAYVSLWSDIITATAALLVVIFAGSWMFLNIVGKRLHNQVSNIQSAFAISPEITDLEAQAVYFNSLVTQISALETNQNWSGLLEKTIPLLSQNGARINSINLAGAKGISANIALLDRNSAIAFRKSMEKNEMLESLAIPLLPIEAKENINMNIKFNLK